MLALLPLPPATFYYTFLLATKALGATTSPIQTKRFISPLCFPLLGVCLLIIWAPILLLLCQDPKHMRVEKEASLFHIHLNLNAFILANFVRPRFNYPFDVQGGISKGIRRTVDPAKIASDTRSGAVAYHRLDKDEDATIFQQAHGFGKGRDGVLGLAPHVGRDDLIDTLIGQLELFEAFGQGNDAVVCLCVDVCVCVCV